MQAEDKRGSPFCSLMSAIVHQKFKTPTLNYPIQSRNSLPKLHYERREIGQRRPDRRQYGQNWILWDCRDSYALPIRGVLSGQHW